MKKFLITLFLLNIIMFPVIAQEEMPFKEEAKESEIIQSEINQNIFPKGEIINYKTYKIFAVDPKKISEKKDQLIIYTPLFGKSTNTDSKGFEAVVVNNRVIKLNQYNSYIPKDGYVISGHGEAKKFILNNIFEGADVDIDFQNAQLKVVTHPDNYIYEASYRIDKAKNILENSNKNEVDVYNMNFYINRAVEILETTKKLVQFEDYENAKKMAEDSMTYSDMALYSSLAYKPDEFKGIWVFPYQKNEKEVKQAFDIIERLNIENIFIETYYNGTTIYKSEIAKKYGLPEQNRYYQDFDPLQAWIDIAKRNNKKVYVTMAPFDMGNPAKSSIKNHIVSVYPKWQNQTHKKPSKKGNLTLDPANPEVKQYTLELIQEVAEKYDIAGINISGMSYPASISDNTKDSWGFTEFARNEFKNLNGIDPISLENSDEKWQQWEKYKEEKITNFVNEIIEFNENNLDLKITFNIYSDAKFASQNIAKWNLNKNIALLPVLNSPDNDFAADFLGEIKEKATGTKIYPIYLEPYLEEKPRRLFDQITIARKMDINGIILYDLDFLSKEYYDALRLCIFRTPSKKKQDHIYVKDKH